MRFEYENNQTIDRNTKKGIMVYRKYILDKASCSRNPYLWVFCQQAVNGIALPQGSNKLYSGGSDGTVRLWDCHTGQCANVINLGGEVGSVCSEGPWVFVGLPNVVKVSFKLCNVLFQFCCRHFVVYLWFVQLKMWPRFGMLVML